MMKPPFQPGRLAPRQLELVQEGRVKVRGEARTVGSYISIGLLSTRTFDENLKEVVLRSDWC